ncbi:MAG: GGDEF domain-containing protein [Eubacteriales bacterium]|nr:GGDEF domain-containing protein [Eubacteriales bacterium]
MENNHLEVHDEGGGISLWRFHAIAAVIITVLAVLLVLSASQTGKGYSRMEAATENYIQAQQAAADMQTASDYLTAEARTFIATGDLTHAERFFEETDVTRRRDQALEKIGALLSSSLPYTYLSAALDKSNELLEIECYSMRLASESYGFDLSDCPEQLREVTLEEADLRLSPAEQRDKALIMVFDETYQNYKDEIQKNVSLTVDALIGETRTQQINSSALLLRLVRSEVLLIVIILLLAIAFVLSTVFLVTRPLKDSIRHIRQDEMLPEKGASELRFLSRTYNQTREQNLLRRRQLSYDATHDALTGLFNRGVFDKLRARCEERDCALLIIDLDRFKAINDQYGHDVGDRALCFVSAILQKNFRAEDYICRIGGDEFSVIMVNVNSAMRSQIEEKIRQINGSLQATGDDLPPLSLSVGVAFSDRENPTDDIYKDADTALYRAKKAHSGLCEFY